MKKDLPIFDIIVNEEDLSQGVGRISLVDEPAIGVDWIALKKQPKMVMAKKVRKSILAKRECFGCPPNGDGTRVNGEPDRRCRDTKGAGGTKGAGSKTGIRQLPPGGKGPKNEQLPEGQSFDPSKQATGGPSTEVPKQGEFYDLKQYQTGVLAPNGSSMTNIYGPEYKNEAVLAANIENGLVAQKTLVVNDEGKRVERWVQADVRDKSNEPGNAEYKAFTSKSPFSDAQIKQYAKTVSYPNIEIPLNDKEIAYLKSGNNTSYSRSEGIYGGKSGYEVEEKDGVTSIYYKVQKTERDPKTGRTKKLDEYGRRKVAEIKGNRLKIDNTYNGPDFTHSSGLGSRDPKSDNYNPNWVRNQREKDLRSIFGYERY